MRSTVKHLMIPFALFALNVLFSAPAQADYKFQQGQFSINATLKDQTTDPDTVTPAFKLKGSVLWTIDEDNYGTETAQITIQRKTYECDYVYSYSDDYTCEITGTKFQQMLDELVTHDANFLAAQQLIKNYYDNTYYNERFEIPVGKLNQNSEDTKTSELRDPTNRRRSVSFEIKNTGMHDF